MNFVFPILLDNNWSISHRQWVIWKDNSTQTNLHKHGLWFVLEVLNKYATSNHIYLILIPQKQGWNSRLNNLAHLHKPDYACTIKDHTQHSAFKQTRYIEYKRSYLSFDAKFYIAYHYVHNAWSKNPLFWSHDENMIFFLHDKCLYFLYEPNARTMIKNALPQCFASIICKNISPADMNTKNVEKTCVKMIIKSMAKSMATGSIINSSVYHTYQNIQTTDNFTSHAHVLK